MPFRPPEEIAAEKFNAAAEENLTDKEWSDAQVTELAVVRVKESEPEPVVSPVQGVSDAEYTARLERMLQEQVVEGWELIRKEAEAALVINPDDATAQYQLLGYQQWERQQNKPKPPGRGLVIPGRVKTRLVEQERTGIWKRTPQGYVIRVAKSSVGDVVKVKRADGTSQKYRLIEMVAHNEFRGVGVA